MQIDQPGRHQFSRCVDRLTCPDWRSLALHRRHFSLRQCDIQNATEVLFRIDDRSTFIQKLIFHRLLFSYHTAKSGFPGVDVGPQPQT